MKRYIIYLLAPIITIWGTSCNNMLDKEPLEMYEGEFVLTTTEGMDLLLTGSYDIISKNTYYGALLYLYEASKGPDFFVRNVAGGMSFYYENQYSETKNLNGNAKSAWLTIYLAIRNTTILIENIDNVKGDIEELRRIKGEAYAIRGLCYFDLMRLFAYPPAFSCTWGTEYDETFKWGVPIMKNVEMGTDILDYEIMRETADDTYAYIVDQFERAVKLLQGRSTAQGHVNAAAATGLMMRARLYMQQWDEVIGLGEEWLAMYENDYAILPYESFTSTYHKSFNSESIWEIGYNTSDNLGSNSLNYWVRKPTYNEPGSERDGSVSSNTGYAKLGLTRGDNNGLDFLSHYTNDIRKYLICEMGIESNPDYRGVRKYVGDPFHQIHNIPVIRLPEIYLTLAEAYARQGDIDKASDLATKVSQPRRRAAANITSATNVLNERRREFILEGHTYWDYFRTNRNISGRQIIESIDDSSINFKSVTGASYRTVYPIPLAEMNANPAIRQQQNPGYGKWEFAIEE